MPEKRRPNIIQILFNLQRQDEGKHLPAPERALDPGMVLLRDWQSRRLARTYADLLLNPEFSAASRFFLSDIYAARDFSQRDQDFERLHELLARFLPPSSLQLLKDGLESNRLSNELDHHLLQVLVDRLGMGEVLSSGMYAEAYRLCDNYAERKCQIAQITKIIQEIGVGARLPLVGISLRLARKPAEAAGWFELYDFLERGYAAFRPMKDVETFARTIEQRETDLLERIYAGESDMF